MATKNTVKKPSSTPQNSYVPESLYDESFSDPVEDTAEDTLGSVEVTAIEATQENQNNGALHLHDADIVSLALDCAANPDKRFDNFKRFAEFIRDGLGIQDKCHLFWSTILNSDWAGPLFTPDFYKRDKANKIYLDIVYSIRDSWAWCVFYPEEVGEYFEIEGDAIKVKANPQVRLMEKENKVTVVKNALGAPSYNVQKPLPNQKLKNGFTPTQMNKVLDYLVVGDFRPIISARKELPQTKKPVAKAAKKTTNKPGTKPDTKPDNTNSKKPVEKKSAKKLKK